ncbi:hybrid NRPS/PKS enzyme [Metarhizium brunneum]
MLPDEPMLMGKDRKYMMTWVLEHLLPQIEAGKHPKIRVKWKDETLEMMQQWCAIQASVNVDMNILHVMGKNLVDIARGTTPPLKVLTQDGMPDRLDMQGLGAQDGNPDLAVIVKQLAHHLPRMRIVEVGAGTGGTTRAILEALGKQYASYRTHLRVYLPASSTWHAPYSVSTAANWPSSINEQLCSALAMWTAPCSATRHEPGEVQGIADWNVMETAEVVL